jgi:hypothetical protein
MQEQKRRRQSCSKMIYVSVGIGILWDSMDEWDDEELLVGAF